MAIVLGKQETEEVVNAIERFFSGELDQRVTGLQARQILRFILLEIAPFAYNRGVKDAEASLRRAIEDLQANCFEPELGWTSEQRHKHAR